MESQPFLLLTRLAAANPLLWLRRFGRVAIWLQCTMSSSKSGAGFYKLSFDRVASILRALPVHQNVVPRIAFRLRVLQWPWRTRKCVRFRHSVIFVQFRHGTHGSNRTFLFLEVMEQAQHPCLTFSLAQFQHVRLYECLYHHRDFDVHCQEMAFRLLTQTEPRVMRRPVEQVWRLRWGAFLACAPPRAFAASLLDVRPSGVDGAIPHAHEVVNGFRCTGLAD